MIRYIMSFAVPSGQQLTAQKIIDSYFEDLDKQGPGGMRSQCYSDNNNECQFVHLKSFRKESVANHHFKSSVFRNYVQQLEKICNDRLSFSRLHQEQSFESIY